MSPPFFDLADYTEAAKRHADPTEGGIYSRAGEVLAILKIKHPTNPELEAALVGLHRAGDEESRALGIFHQNECILCGYKTKSKESQEAHKGGHLRDLRAYLSAHSESY